MSVSQSPKREHWTDSEEAGNYAGLKFFVLVYRLFGRRVFSILMTPVIFYFFLRRSRQRRCSQDYLQRLYRYSPESFSKRPGLWHSYRHFRAFGESLLDKTIAWSDAVQQKHIEVVDQAVYDQVMQDPRGRLMIGSHFGNLELCRGFAARHRPMRIHVLMHEANAQQFARLMQREVGDSRTHVIAVTELDVATILRLREYVNRGDWIVITGDRVAMATQERQVEVDFLGARAAFPIGPYILAATLQCPVDLIFGYREGKRVKLAFERFCEPLTLERRQREQQLTGLAQAYANSLAAYCAQAPYQWFNFFPFWIQCPSNDEPEHANQT